MKPDLFSQLIEDVHKRLNTGLAEPMMFENEIPLRLSIFYRILFLYHLPDGELVTLVLNSYSFSLIFKILKRENCCVFIKINKMI